MNCAWRKSNRQPILRYSGNWKASTGRRWESGIRNTELLLHQWIRLLSRLLRARCSEAVSNPSRAPSGSFDRISVWGYKPLNDAEGRRRNSPAPGGQRWKPLNRRSESSVEKNRNHQTLPAWMIEPSWQGKRKDLHLTPWVRPQRIAAGCRKSVLRSRITSHSGDMKAI